MDACRTRDGTAAAGPAAPRLRPWWRDEDGAAAYEYAILAAVPAIGLAVVLQDLGWSLTAFYEYWVGLIVAVAQRL